MVVDQVFPMGYDILEILLSHTAFLIMLTLCSIPNILMAQANTSQIQSALTTFT